MGERVTENEFHRIEELCNEADKLDLSGRLTQWEERFLLDLDDMIEQFGRNMHVSVRQWEIIDRIEKKVYAT